MGFPVVSNPLVSPNNPSGAVRLLFFNEEVRPLPAFLPVAACIMLASGYIILGVYYVQEAWGFHSDHHIRIQPGITVAPPSPSGAPVTNSIRARPKKPSAGRHEKASLK